jgi:hypothetical protein
VLKGSQAQHLFLQLPPQPSFLCIDHPMIHNFVQESAL